MSHSKTLAVNYVHSLTLMQQHHIRTLNDWHKTKSPTFHIIILKKLRAIAQGMYKLSDREIATTYSCTYFIAHYNYSTHESYFLDKLLTALINVNEEIILAKRYPNVPEYRHGHGIPKIAKYLMGEDTSYRPHINKQLWNKHKCMLRKRYLSFVINHCNITIKKLENQLCNT